MHALPMTLKFLPLALLTVFATAGHAACLDQQLRDGYPNLAFGQFIQDVNAKLGCVGEEGDETTDRFGRTLLDVTWKGATVTIQAVLQNRYLKSFTAINLDQLDLVPADPQWDPASAILTLPVLAVVDPAKAKTTYRINVRYALYSNGSYAELAGEDYDAQKHGQIPPGALLPTYDLVSGFLTLPRLTTAGKLSLSTQLILASTGVWDRLQGDNTIPAPSGADTVPGWSALTRTLNLPLLALSDAKGGLTYRANVRYSLLSNGRWLKLSDRTFNPAVDGLIPEAATLPALDVNGILSIPLLDALDTRSRSLNTTLRLGAEGAWDALKTDGLFTQTPTLDTASRLSTFDTAARTLKLPVLTITDTAKGVSKPSYFANVGLILGKTGLWTLNSVETYDPVLQGSIRTYDSVASYDLQNQTVSIPELFLDGKSSRNITIALRDNGTWNTLDGDSAGILGGTRPSQGIGSVDTAGTVLNYGGVKTGTILTLNNGKAFRVTGACSILSSEETIPSKPIREAVGVPGSLTYIPPVFGTARIPAAPLATIYNLGFDTLVVTIQGDNSTCDVVRLF